MKVPYKDIPSLLGLGSSGYPNFLKMGVRDWLGPKLWTLWSRLKISHAGSRFGLRLWTGLKITPGPRTCVVGWVGPLYKFLHNFFLINKFLVITFLVFE